MSEKDLELDGTVQENDEKKDKHKKKIDVVKGIQMLEDKLCEAEGKLEQAAKEIAETKDSFQRTLAEYDNFRKRSVKEKTDSYNNGKISAVMALLPTLDVLEIAFNAPCTDEEYKKGLEMIFSTAKTSLANLGVEEIEAVGKPFDPNFHAAVMQESVEGTQSGVVTKQLQKGYKMGDKVIRHSTVAVSC